jgi:hypothetical protein
MDWWVREEALEASSAFSLVRVRTVRFRVEIFTRSFASETSEGDGGGGREGEGSGLGLTSSVDEEGREEESEEAFCDSNRALSFLFS